jgi:hypothetical protein
MRIPVNYGEVNIRPDKIVVGPGWISRTIGWLMLVFILVVAVFLLISGFTLTEMRQEDIGVLFLFMVTIYLGLRFMGGWSDRMVIDGRSKTIVVTKRWLFLPIRRVKLYFNDVHYIHWREVSDQSTGWKDTDMAEVAFVLKRGDAVSIASVSYVEPKAGLRIAENIAQRVGNIVGCPSRSPSIEKNSHEE